MADKEGGGYRHRAKGDKGVVIHVSPEVHALIKRAVHLLGANGEESATMQSCLAREMEAWARRVIEAHQQAPPAEPGPKRRKT